MTIYEKPTPKGRPVVQKKPLNLHPSTHERYFRLLGSQRERTGKMSMTAGDFLVDLMDMYEKDTADGR